MESDDGVRMEVGDVRRDDGSPVAALRAVAVVAERAHELRLGRLQIENPIGGVGEHAGTEKKKKSGPDVKDTNMVVVYFGEKTKPSRLGPGNAKPLHALWAGRLWIERMRGSCCALAFRIVRSAGAGDCHFRDSIYSATARSCGPAS